MKSLFNQQYVVYTALFGDYDKLHELSFKSPYCEYVCFTDQDIDSDSWTIIKMACDEENTVLMNRKLKMCPHIYLSNFTASIYIDTNIKITKDIYPLFEKYLQKNLITFPYHFLRNCIYKELDECVASKKISKNVGMEWEAYLKKESFPENYGLAENNILIRKHNVTEVIDLMDKWFAYFKQGIKRDQLSLMYLIWKRNIPFSFMDETARNNNLYFKYYLHKSARNIKFSKRIFACVQARQHRNKFYSLCFYIMKKVG